MIEEIKNKITITDLLNRIGLQPSASGFISSIYKEEKTPSLKIYSAENRYHCFATDQGGDVIDFYRDYYRVDARQAIKELTDIAGIEQGLFDKERKPGKITFGRMLPTRLIASLSKVEKSVFEVYNKENFDYSANDEIDNIDDFRKVFETKIQRIKKKIQKIRLAANKKIFAELYRYSMLQGFDRAALRYLMKDRNLPLKEIERFKLFTITNYYKINQHLKKTFNTEDLQRSGLFNEKGNLIFAKHKIIIPYLHNGEIVYMRGRYFDGGASADHIKYIGLRNDELDVNTAKRFFNRDITRTALEGEKIYITEGEFDVIAASGMGYNAVGIPGAGSLPSLDKMNFFKYYQPVICVDNDEAGGRLKDKLMDRFSKMNIAFGIKHLNNKDINEFITSG